MSGTHHNVFPNSNSDADRDCVKFGKLDGTDEQIERVSCADMYFPLCQRPLRLAPTQVRLLSSLSVTQYTRDRK